MLFGGDEFCCLALYALINRPVAFYNVINIAPTHRLCVSSNVHINREKINITYYTNASQKLKHPIHFNLVDIHYTALLASKSV